MRVTLILVGGSQSEDRTQARTGLTKGECNMHWLLEINTNTGNTTTATENKAGLTAAEVQIFTELLTTGETNVPTGNLFLWAMAHREQLEANAKSLGLTLVIKDRRIVWSAPAGHKYHSGSGRVARLKDVGSIALCYGSKVAGASGLGSTKEKERRTQDLISLWKEPETLEPLEAVAETPKPAKKAKKGKTIKK